MRKPIFVRTALAVVTLNYFTPVMAVDVGVYYTSSAKAAYGNNVESLRSAIMSEISTANSALAQAGANHRFNVRYISESSIGSGSTTGAAGGLKSDSTANSDASVSGVDIQIIYLNAGADACGAETHNGPGNDRNIASMSYVSVNTACMGQGSTAHELGHSHGMGHQDGEGAIVPYAVPEICNSQATLMYSSGQQLMFYSDPTKTNGEDACGIADEKDNARLARERGSVLENHRSFKAAASVGLALRNISVDEETGVAEIGVTLSNAVSEQTYFEAYTSNGSANGSDFSWSAQRVAIPLGVTNFSFNIPVVNDTVPEAAETFTVGIRDGVGVTASGTATVTIEESDVVEVVDGKVAFGQSSVTVNEGASVSIPVQRTNSSTGDAVVSFSISNGNISYLSSTELTLAPNASGNLTVSIPQDSVAEGNRSFTISLTHPDPQLLGNVTTVTLNVIEDDTTGYIRVPESAINHPLFWATHYKVTEGDTINVPLVREGGNIGEISTTAFVGSGIGSSVQFDGNIVFADGASSGQLTIVIPDNTDVDGTREVSIDINTGKENEGIFSPSIVVEIADNDAPADNNNGGTGTGTGTGTGNTDGGTNTGGTDSGNTNGGTNTGGTDSNSNVISNVMSIESFPETIKEGEEFTFEVVRSRSDNKVLTLTLWAFGDSSELSFEAGEERKEVTKTAPKDSSTDDVAYFIQVVGPNNRAVEQFEVIDTDLEGQVEIVAEDGKGSVVEGEDIILTIRRTEGSEGQIEATLTNLEGVYDDVEVVIYDGKETAQVTIASIDDAEMLGDATATFRLINANTDVATNDTIIVTVYDDEAPGRVTFEIESINVYEGDEYKVVIKRVGGDSGEVELSMARKSPRINSAGRLTFEDGETEKVFTYEAILDDSQEDFVETFELKNNLSNKSDDVLGDVTKLTVNHLNTDLGTVDEPYVVESIVEEPNIVVGESVTFTITRPDRLFGDVEFTVFNEALGINTQIVLPADQTELSFTVDTSKSFLEADSVETIEVKANDGMLVANVEVTAKPLEQQELVLTLEAESVQQDEKAAVIINRPENYEGEVTFDVTVVEVEQSFTVTLAEGEALTVFELSTSTIAPQDLTIIFVESSLKQYRGEVKLTITAKPAPEPVKPVETKKDSSGGSFGWFSLMLVLVMAMRKNKA